MQSIEMTQIKQPWIRSAPFDLVFFILPWFLGFGFMYNYPNVAPEGTLFTWIFLKIILVGTHNWATVPKTIFNADLKQKIGYWMLAFPLLIGVLWYPYVMKHVSDMNIFLAYLGIVHTSRQQYGFMMIYSGKERTWIDKTALYTSILYPLICWISKPGIQPLWGNNGVLIHLDSRIFVQLGKYFYFGVLALFLRQEFNNYRKTKIINLPKNLFLLGNGLIYYLGAAVRAGNQSWDLYITLMACHSISYNALVWSYNQRSKVIFPKLTRSVFGYIGFIGVSASIFALVEIFMIETHGLSLGKYAPTPSTFALGIYLISLPSVLHVMSDFFIWKKKFSTQYPIAQPV